LTKDDDGFERILVVAWDDTREWCHEIELAVRADGSVPAHDFLRLLRTGNLPGDPVDGKLPSDAQLSQYDRFLAACRYLAEYGEPKNRSDVNELEDGIWELRVATKRISWFDTDGRGGYEPKFWIRDNKDSLHPQMDFWWFPDFDATIRLGHSFIKRTQRTEPADLQLSQQVRDEDVAHDHP
jgi:phage-related protein